MACQNDMFGDLDDDEEYLTVIAKEAKEALLDRKLMDMQKKNWEIHRRHAEVEADRRAAEESGCSVTSRSSNAGSFDQGKTNEVQKLGEEETKGRDHGQDGGCRRPRGPRAGPHGHHGSRRDNHTAEFDSVQNSNSDKFVSTGVNSSSDKVSSSRDWVAGRPPEVSASHNSPHPRYNSQGSRESNQSQRSGGGRGGYPRPKYVTVPDALHSHDVRHVEQVNDSIVVNIDRSAKPVSEPRGRGRRGGEAGADGGGGSRGAPGRSDFSSRAFGDIADLQIVDRDVNVGRCDAALRRGGRRPFRGQGQDGSYRGQGGFRRGRGDGPRPFRGGYRRGRTRDGRGARRAVIHVVTSSGGDVENPCVREEGGEDWDKETVVAVSGVGVDGGDDRGWPGGDAMHQEEQQRFDDFEDGGGSHVCDESLLSGVCDIDDGVEPNREQDGRPDHGNGGKTGCLLAGKENSKQGVTIAEGKEDDVKACSPGAGIKETEDVKSDTGVEGGHVGSKQKSAEMAKKSAKVGEKVSPRPTEAAKDDNLSGENAVVGNIVEDISHEMTENLKQVKSDKPIVALPTAADSKTSAERKSKITTASSAEVLSSPGASSDAGNSNSVMHSGDTVSEIPTVVDKKT